MNNKLIFITFLLFLNIIGFSQNMGNVCVNMNNTATLKFDDVVKDVFFGTNPIITENKVNRYLYYDCFKLGTVVLFKLMDSVVEKSSITVILNNEDVYYGSIQKCDSTKILYDYRASKNKENKSQISKEDILLQNLKKVMEEKDIDNEDWSSNLNNIVLLISNIRNDSEHTYIKLVIYNQSGGEFKINNVSFRYKEGKSKGPINKDKNIEEPIITLLEYGNMEVKAYSKSDLGFVLPLFSIGEKGVFIIHLIEKTGTRNLRIEIKGEEMLKVKIIKD